jgi:2-phospho-L-lactate guanylyltransferase
MSPERSSFRPWAVIPAKRFSRAKSRLASVLEAHERRELARALFERVLGACTDCRELQGTLVATDGEDAALAGRRRGAAILRDHEGAASRLGAVVDTALTWLGEHGATHAVVVMADLPLLSARDLDELLAQLRTRDMVIAPDLQRRGTSALGLRLGLGVCTCFGHSDSLQRHLDEAARASVSRLILHNPHIAFDLDSPADLLSFARDRRS